MTEGNKRTWAMWLEAEQEEPSLDVLNIRDNPAGDGRVPIEQCALEHSRENTTAIAQQALETKEEEGRPEFGLKGAWKKKFIKDIERKSNLQSFDWSNDETQSQSQASNWTANEGTKYLTDQLVWQKETTADNQKADAQRFSTVTETKVKEAEECNQPGSWRQKSIIQFASAHRSSLAPMKTKEESERHLSWRQKGTMWGMRKNTLPGRNEDTQQSQSLMPYHRSDEHTKYMAHLPIWRSETKEYDLPRVRDFPSSFATIKAKEEKREESGRPGSWRKNNNMIRDMRLKNILPSFCRSVEETLTQESIDPSTSQTHDDACLHDYLTDWSKSEQQTEKNDFSQGFALEDPLSSGLMETKAEEVQESEQSGSWSDMQLMSPSIDWSLSETQTEETVDPRKSQTDEYTKYWSGWPKLQNKSTDLSAELPQSLSPEKLLSSAPLETKEEESERSESWNDLRLKSILSCIDWSTDETLNQDPVDPRKSQANEDLQFLVDRPICQNKQIESSTNLPQSAVPADHLSTDLMETEEVEAEESKLSGSMTRKNMNLMCEVQINSAGTFTWTIVDTQTSTQNVRLKSQHWAKKPFRKMVKEREAKLKPVIPTKDLPKTTPQGLETEKKIVGLGIKSWKKGLLIKDDDAKVKSNIALIDAPKKDSQPVACHVTTLPTPCKAIDVPLTAWEQDSSELDSLLPVMPVCRYRIPNKITGYTIKSTKIEIITNYLPVVVRPLQILRYIVTFMPDKPQILCDKAFKLIKDKHFPKQLTAFDQIKFLYCLKPLEIPGASDDGFSKNVNVVGYRDKTFNVKVSIKTGGVIDLNGLIQYMKTDGSSMAKPTEAIQAVDIILRQGPLESFIKSGRKFYKRPSNPSDLGHGMEIWTGLFQSALFTSAAFVNVDISHKGFPKAKKLTDLLVSDFHLDLNRSLELQSKTKVEYFKAFVLGVKISLDYKQLDPSNQSTSTRNEYYCNDIVKVPAKQYFNLESGDIILNVAEYYAKFKKYSIKYPNLNCLWVGPKNKSIYWPMELVYLSSEQLIYKPHDDVQNATMSRTATPVAAERKRKIEEVISHMNYSKSKCFRKFGLEIDDKLISISAKLLEPPLLDVGDKHPIIPSNGSWIAKRFFKAGTLQSWAFITLEPSITCDINAFLAMVIDTGKCMGMLISKPNFVMSNVNMEQFSSSEFKHKLSGLRLLLILISDSVENHYQKVKTMAERELGIVTQCVRSVTLLKPQSEMASIVRNLMLKINSKLMGINQTLNRSCMPKCLAKGGVMIVGADVTHPSQLQTSVPSIAAITATIDAAPSYFSYNIELSVQTPKREIIVEFEDMMVDHLMVYKNRNGTLPKKIYVFRDGVSDGELAQVMNYELSAVYLAYQRMTGTLVKPEVLFVVVQKRHHTRFFSSRDYQNVVPGTVVDTHIVHGNELDFYMVSHQAIKGTARPTRYRVVCNDGRIPADEVEQLTFYLCHLYARCMRSVSYPTPTYYAHLACVRARALTYNDVFSNLEEMPQRLRMVKKLLEQSRMFFV